jgi:hypothetical protein
VGCSWDRGAAHGRPRTPPGGTCPGSGRSLTLTVPYGKSILRIEESGGARTLRLPPALGTRAATIAGESSTAAGLPGIEEPRRKGAMIADSSCKEATRVAG